MSLNDHVHAIILSRKLPKIVAIQLVLVRIHQTSRVSRNKLCCLLREMPVLLPISDGILCDIRVQLQIHTFENVIESITCRSSVENFSDILYIFFYIMSFCNLKFLTNA